MTAAVVRGGQSRELPLSHLVPGDVVHLAAGDMIPADLRIVSCKDLFVIQSSLTGASLPVEKSDSREDAGPKMVLELKNTCFLGTSVESGTAKGVIVETGFRTYLGGMARAIVGQKVQTSFDKGVARFTWLMIRFMLVMVPLVFLINGLTKHNGIEAFFFAMAVAVGLTPEMLPMIVSVCLSRGAITMSGKKVIVKRLNSIQNLGAMDVLCSDKTGTLTLDRVILERHCDVVRHEDDGVLMLAYLNSHFQTGLKNVLDRAILQFRELHEKLAIPEFRKVDEIPFDFSRKLMSVVVETPEGIHRLICKGAAAEKTTLFARLSPAHKQRIIRALQRKGHVVGFLGDGINDSPALRTADVGISVDSAVDIAKEAADIILLEKSLLVLQEGVVEGRKVFANILKYVRMGASSNFGNMFSVLGGSAFVPYLPMAPIQILTSNLLYDFSQAPIPADDVDADQIAKPRPWHMGDLTRFILFVGPCSSIFDYTTYLMMLYVFNGWDPANASLFQTGWFVESLLTQTLIIHIIRTNRIPFLQSRASWPLTVTTAIIMAIGIWLPSSTLGHWLGFTPLPPLYWPLLALTLCCYVLLTQGVKMWLIRKAWI